MTSRKQTAEKEPGRTGTRKAPARTRRAAAGTTDAGRTGKTAGGNRPLIVVESPTKARTIARILGGDYDVLSSNGHVVDLPEKKLSVDVEHGFALDNRVIPGKKKFLDQIVKTAKGAARVLLATDPDREGEAIAYLIARQMGLPEEKVSRVLFHEITREGVARALAEEGPIDQHLFQAQQARRAIDRLVGYKLSPLLWEKVRRGLSAGRVQSVALRLVCDREKEIRAFLPEDYWVVTALLASDAPPPFRARLVSREGKKLRIKEAGLAEEALRDLPTRPFRVREVRTRPVRRSPAPPFITSTLQQEAARKLGFSAKKTMVIAQQLYEGVVLGEQGPTGLITYMRTDSVRVSDEAVNRARAEVEKRFGPRHLPEARRTYKNRKGVQDAHEAIRPSRPDLDPDSVAPFLDRDQARLYELVYKRFLASQMSDAELEKTRVAVEAGPWGLSASGQRTLFAGFLALYEEGRDETERKNGIADGKGEAPEEAVEEAGEEVDLPYLAPGQILALRDLSSEKKTTQPPPRYTEATLVKELEEKGIGRPSTYASILDTLERRHYAEKEKIRFVPTPMGEVVCDLLVQGFPRLLDVGFTAQMEDTLDSVEEGERSYLEVVSGFYHPFAEELSKAGTQLSSVKEGIPAGIDCPRCGKMLVIRQSRRTGGFLACSGYPDCKFTSNYERVNGGEVRMVERAPRTEICPQCGSPMVLRQSRSGPFLGCSRYPDCKGTLPLATGVPCPRPGCSGALVEKRTKKGRIFYSCSSYPSCRFALWDPPVARACPACGFPLMTRRANRSGTTLACPNADCRHKMADEGN